MPPIRLVSLSMLEVLSAITDTEDGTGFLPITALTVGSIIHIAMEAGIVPLPIHTAHLVLTA